MLKTHKWMHYAQNYRLPMFALVKKGWSFGPPLQGEEVDRVVSAARVVGQHKYRPAQASVHCVVSLFRRFYRLLDCAERKINVGHVSRQELFDTWLYYFYPDMRNSLPRLSSAV